VNRVLGTPNEDTWPGVTALQDWNDDFPVWPALNLAHFMPNFSDEGINLVEQLITLDPRRRYTATECLNHPYFAGMN
jgi:serine/threonine protein kinase